MSVSPQHRRAGFGANLPRSSLVVVPAGGAQVSSWREAKMIEVPSAASPRIQVLPQLAGKTISQGQEDKREIYWGFSGRCAGAQRGLYTAISSEFERRLVA